MHPGSPASPRPPPPLAVTFDLDGTLAEVRLRRLRMWPGMVRHGRILAAYPAAVEALRGQRQADLDAALARRIAARCGRPEAVVRRVLDEWIDRRWPALFAGARPTPAVMALIQRCDRLGLPRAVVSDHPPEAKLAAMGLGGWRATIACRRLGALKPLPDGLQAAAEALGLPVDRILHVGDRPETDGAMAAAAGAAFISVARLEAGERPLASLS